VSFCFVTDQSKWIRLKEGKRNPKLDIRSVMGNFLGRNNKWTTALYYQCYHSYLWFIENERTESRFS